MKIKVMSQDEALKYSNNTDKRIAIISIVGAKEKPLEFNEEIVCVFRMFFEDIERPIGNYKAPSKEDFKGLKDFIDNNMDSVDEIVVHCHAGVSRSAACASAIARYIGVNDLFIWSSSDYMPNRLVFSCTIGELGVDLDENEIKSLYKMNEDAHVLSLEFID
ncbi:MAG: dual specificity protein phosphatase family protein [Clostridium sp.]|nr:dual specificity protein phosphatase family protein [Clostridium sp.]MBQ8997592.1 dual specificity protein phosphatase family protein [Clostridium sp.]